MEIQQHLALSNRVTYSSTAVLIEYSITGTRLDLTWDEITNMYRYSIKQVQPAAYRQQHEWKSLPISICMLVTARSTSLPLIWENYSRPREYGRAAVASAFGLFSGFGAIYRLAALINYSCVTSVLVCLTLSQESVGRFSSNKLQECGGGTLIVLGDPLVRYIFTRKWSI